MVMRKRAADRAVAVKSAPRRRTRAARPTHDKAQAVGHYPDAKYAAQADGKYAVHPGVISLQRWIRDLAASTGRSLTQWIAHIQEEGPASERACRLWLREKYAMGGSNALWLAANAFENCEALAESTPDGYLALAPRYVEQLFSGAKSRLLPLYEDMLIVARKLHAEVKICPCKAAVSLYRRKLFARLTPHSPRRLDLGLSLSEEPHTSRLLKSPRGNGCERITHFVALSSVDDLDLQVKRWLKQACDRAT